MSQAEATHRDSIYVYMLWLNLSISIVVCKVPFYNQLLYGWNWRYRNKPFVFEYNIYWVQTSHSDEEEHVWLIVWHRNKPILYNNIKSPVSHRYTHKNSKHTTTHPTYTHTDTTTTQDWLYTGGGEIALLVRAQGVWPWGQGTNPSHCYNII